MTTMRVVGECFFWYRLTRVFPDKFHRAVKRLCVCVCSHGNTAKPTPKATSTEKFGCTVPNTSADRQRLICRQTYSSQYSNVYIALTELHWNGSVCRQLCPVYSVQLVQRGRDRTTFTCLSCTICDRLPLVHQIIVLYNAQVRSQ